ncbi:hypothetical protein V8J38_14050 [Brevundimonas olei]|uniref:Uncharacterized protein n=1 Tax=Brevundimonas olei TaxID=657642 RepID=A0ABZ2IHC8_9CAUL
MSKFLTLSSFSSIGLLHQEGFLLVWLERQRPLDFSSCRLRFRLFNRLRFLGGDADETFQEMENYSPAVLRAVVKAAVLRAAPNITAAQGADIARRVIAADQPEITFDGDVRLASGEALSDALARHAQSAPHLFESSEASAQADAAALATRAKLKALKPGDRLEAANSGVTAGWVRDFRKGAAQ